MEIFKYKDYDDYVSEQILRHKDKFNKTRPQEYYFEQMKYIFENMDKIEPISSIVCMGVRNDNEIEMFKRIFSNIPNIEVYGTDISYQNPGNNIFRLDFAECPEDWHKRFDLLYSNSIDHSFDVLKTLGEWKRVTKKYMILEFSGEESSKTDPFSVGDINEVYNLCETVGGIKVLDIDKQLVTLKVEE